MSICILQPGMLTTVQDIGRFGYQQFGMPTAGAVDPRSAMLGNILVGNPVGAAVLECTMLGPVFCLQNDTVFAVTGGDLSPTLNGREIPSYQAIMGKAGDVVAFGSLRSGCRAYIAFSGGIDVPLVMGSRSTYLKAKLGGFDGRRLQKGDVVPIGAVEQSLDNLECRRTAREYTEHAVDTLRVVMGPQDDAFTMRGIETFLAENYTVTAESDRMGCRMDGPVVEHRTAADIISDGVVCGSVQIPASGKPIIMLADHQTTGGYTKIATVISADFRLLGQLKAGDLVHFAAVTIEEAQEALLAQRASLSLLEEALNRK